MEGMGDFARAESNSEPFCFAPPAFCAMLLVTPAQSNAVRWLSQSLTDTIKRRQDQAAEFIKSLARYVI